MFKPAPCHLPGLAPAMCLCVDCSRKMLALRCPARDEQGRQCGNYRHRGKEHWLIVCTVFQIAVERVDYATFGPLPTW